VRLPDLEFVVNTRDQPRVLRHAPVNARLL
jgi:hypothetical protein